MKIRLTLIIIASLLLFQGASPWEGSAAVAPNGELPITGFYIATNAYPKNTVVDITNIESGKKTRVIVSNTLTSPGLLAVVSREAAELIGMRAGSISRIRMIQPSDPMAYMRFTESMAKGTPEYDSGNVIDEDKLMADVYKKDTYTPPEVVRQPTEKPAVPPTAPGYIVDEPEWGGNGRLQIVDVPGYMIDPSEQPTITQIPNDKELEKENKEPLFIAEQNKEDAEKGASIENNEKPPKEVIKDVPEFNDKPPKEAIKDVPTFITEAQKQEVVKDASPWQEKVEVVTTPQKQPEQVLELVEASPNPPSSNVYGIDPNDIIPNIVITAPDKTDERVIKNAPSTPTSNLNPSIRTIERLDRGKYYVQVAALPSDLVENVYKQIDKGFAPVVFKGADNMYRILIGPLNQGESAAVLVRFRSIGYKDAFVRIGG
jgi:hypothetical protein